MNLTKNQTQTKKHVSSELDTDQGKGVTNKWKYLARQLKYKYRCVLNEYQMSIVRFSLLLSMIKY